MIQYLAVGSLPCTGILFALELVVFHFIRDHAQQPLTLRRSARPHPRGVADPEDPTRDTESLVCLQ